MRALEPPVQSLPYVIEFPFDVAADLLKPRLYITNFIFPNLFLLISFSLLLRKGRTYISQICQNEDEETTMAGFAFLAVQVQVHVQPSI